MQQYFWCYLCVVPLQAVPPKGSVILVRVVPVVVVHCCTGCNTAVIRIIMRINTRTKYEVELQTTRRVQQHMILVPAVLLCDSG